MSPARLRDRILQAAKRLSEAAELRRPVAPLTGKWEDLNLAEAYAIQAEVVRYRLARGERVVGVKLGLTSPAKQGQMGIHSPITGWLTDAMQLPDGVSLPREKLIHPRAEPEIVFIMRRRLVGPGVTAEAVLQATECVCAGIEIIDSRYENFRFTLPDVVADNASAAFYVLGRVRVRPSALDLAREGCVLEVNGTIIATATGAEVQGHPAEAVARAVNALAERNLAVEAGWIVMTGGLTNAVAVAPGATIRARFTHLGTVTIHGGD